MRSLGWTLSRQERRNGVQVRLYRPETTDAALPDTVEALPTADGELRPVPDCEEPEAPLADTRPAES